MKIEDVKKENYSITNITIVEDNKYISCYVVLPNENNRELETLFRITDKENGEYLDLVSIDYGYKYKTVALEWSNIREDLKDIAIKHMENTYHKAYGKSYNDENRRQLPLPLTIAYAVALRKLNK